MGQVFTWDAVYHGRIPTKRKFEMVADALRTALAREPAIAVALLFGSIVRGDSNCRSDVDAVVIYHLEEERRAIETLHDLDLFAHTLHVPINYTICDTTIAKTRLHYLHAAFVRHLQAAIEAGGVIKGDLASLLAPTAPEKQEIESYLSHKFAKLQNLQAKWASLSDEATVRFLQKALEAPMHAARKMLIYEGKMGGDSKREVAQRYGDVMPSSLGDQLEWLLHVDAAYTKEIERQQEGSDGSLYSGAMYNIALEKLRAEVPAVLAFLRGNILRLDAIR